MLFTRRGLLRSECRFQFLHLLLLIEQLDCVLLRIYHRGTRGEIKSVGTVRKYRPWALTTLEAEPSLRIRNGLTREKGVTAFFIIQYLGWFLAELMHRRCWHLLRRWKLIIFLFPKARHLFLISWLLSCELSLSRVVTQVPVVDARFAASDEIECRLLRWHVQFLWLGQENIAHFVFNPNRRIRFLVLFVWRHLIHF